MISSIVRLSSFIYVYICSIMSSSTVCSILHWHSSPACCGLSSSIVGRILPSSTVCKQLREFFVLSSSQSINLATSPSTLLTRKRGGEKREVGIPHQTISIIVICNIIFLIS